MDSMTILLMIVFLPILLVIYVMMRNLTKPKKNVVLGVTLPYEARNEPEVTDIGAKYRKWLAWILVFSLVTGAGVLIPTFVSVQFTYLMIWFFLVVFLPYIPYTVYHQKLKRLKKERGWRKETAASTLVDIKVAAEEKRSPSILWFILPLAVSLLPLLFILSDISGHIDVFMSVLVNVLLILVFLASDRMICRQKGEIIGSDSAVNAMLTRMRKRYWHKCWLVLSWVTAAVSVLLYAVRDVFWAMMLIYLFYIVAILVICIGVELRVRKIQAKLSKESGQDVYLDEDDYWINGMFYYNPNDRHFMKNERIGMGMTINLGRWSGKVTGIITILLLMIIPLMCIWIAAEEFTPMTLSVTDGYVVSHHLRDEYKIKLDDITSVELADSVSAHSRIVGIGLPNVSKGLFSVEGYGNAEVCYNPKEGPYVVVVTADKTYIFGSDTEGEAAAVYKHLYSIVPALP